MITNVGSTPVLQCESTDEKPTTGVEINTIIEELDTGNDYYFTGITWAKIGG